MSLAINGSYNKTSTQFASDGSINITARGGIEPYLYRVYKYFDGQYTEWTESNNIGNLPCGYYHIEVLDGDGVNHPYPLHEIKAEYIVEETKGDGAKYVLDHKDNSVYEFINVPKSQQLPTSNTKSAVIIENDQNDHAALGELDIMLNNMTYHEESFRYPFKEEGCFYQISELNKLPFGDWRVPTYNDYMYILNQIPDLTTAGVRQYFEDTLKFEYDGFIENGYEHNGSFINDRQSFKNIYAQYWIDKSGFKKKFSMSLCKLNFSNVTSLQMLYKSYSDDLNYTPNMLQVRMVRNTGNNAPTLTELTLLKGYNYFRLPENMEGSVSDIFGDKLNNIVHIKTDGGDAIVKLYIREIPGVMPVLDTIGTMVPGQLYMVHANQSFRIPVFEKE